MGAVCSLGLSTVWLSVGCCVQVTASHHIFLSSIVYGAKLVLMFKWDAGQVL